MRSKPPGSSPPTIYSSRKKEGPEITMRSPPSSQPLHLQLGLTCGSESQTSTLNCPPLRSALMPSSSKTTSAVSCRAPGSRSPEPRPRGQPGASLFPTAHVRTAGQLLSSIDSGSICSAPSVATALLHVSVTCLRHLPPGLRQPPHTSSCRSQGPSLSTSNTAAREIFLR